MQRIGKSGEFSASVAIADSATDLAEFTLNGATQLVFEVAVAAGGGDLTALEIQVKASAGAEYVKIVEDTDIDPASNNQVFYRSAAVHTLAAGESAVVSLFVGPVHAVKFNATADAAATTTLKGSAQ